MARVPRFQAFATSLLATAMVAAGLAAVPLALAQQLPTWPAHPIRTILRREARRMSGTSL